MYSAELYNQAMEQEKAWLDSIDAGDSPYNTDYRSRYWGSNWSYASGLIAEKSDTFVYDVNLLTAWYSQKSSNGISEKITFVFEPVRGAKSRRFCFFR